MVLCKGKKWPLSNASPMDRKPASNARRGKEKKKKKPKKHPWK